MCITGGQHLDVKIHTGAVGYGIEKFSYQFSIQTANTLYGEVSVKYKIRSSAEIYSTKSKGFIHGKNKITVTTDAFFDTDGFFNGLSKHNTGIFYGMMTVYNKIAFNGTA